MTADLLRLLEAAHTGRTQGNLLAMIEALPDRKPSGAPRKPVQRRVGSWPVPASMKRRRQWAASGRLPPKMAARFTLAEQAVLAAIGAKVAEEGSCTLTLEHIAALAGMCRKGRAASARLTHSAYS